MTPELEQRMTALRILLVRWTEGNHVAAPPLYEAGWREASEAFTDDLREILDEYEKGAS